VESNHAPHRARTAFKAGRRPPGVDLPRRCAEKRKAEDSNPMPESWARIR